MTPLMLALSAIYAAGASSLLRWWWRRSFVWAPLVAVRHTGVATELRTVAIHFLVPESGRPGSVVGGWGQAGPHLHRLPRVPRLRLRLDVDSSLEDRRRWPECSGGQEAMLIVLANIATDRLVALHVFGFTPGRLLLRCNLRPRSPWLRPGGPQLVCKRIPQLGFDGDLDLSGLRHSILWATC